MADEKENENEKTNAKLDQLLSGLDTLVNNYNDLSDRMDAIEGKGKKPGEVDPPLDAADDDDDDFDDMSPDEQKRWMDEERARAMKEGRAPGAPEELAADARKIDAMRKSEGADAKRRRTDSRKADAQARADSVLAMEGQRAPAPLSGERTKAYRTRLLRDLLPHSETYRGVDIGAIKDPRLFAIAEKKVIEDAVAAFRNPQLGAREGLRMIEKRTDSGHTERSFVGDTGEFIGMFSGNGQIATIDVRGGRPN